MAASADSRAVAALAGILWAYFDRMAAGDWPRATALLRSFQTLYSQSSAAVRREGASTGFTLPTSIPSTGSWGPANVQPAQVILGLSILFDRNQARVLPVLERMPATASDIGPWFTELLVAVPPADVADLQRQADAYASISAAELPARITLAFAEHVEGRTAPASTVSFGRDPFGFVAQQAADVVQQGEEMLVTGRGVAAQMPMWGWVALAVGGATAAGVLIWGLMGKRKAGTR